MAGASPWLVLVSVLAVCSSAEQGPDEGDAVALLQQGVLQAGGLQAQSDGDEGLSTEPAPEVPSNTTLKERVSQLEAAKAKAIELEDFDLAKELKREIGVLLGEGNIERLQDLKKAAIEDEDFDLAKDLKLRIQILENSTRNDPLFAEKLKALPATGQLPLPWGWRSAKDPSSGLEYFWPVNDRSATTWERPTAPAPGVAPPAAQVTTVVKTTTPPLLYEVRNKEGVWSKCNISGNGTKPGTYNITVRAQKGYIELPNIPAVALRNASSLERLAPDPLEVLKANYSTIARSLDVAQVLPPNKDQKTIKVGDRMELKSKDSWVPCVVTGEGNETKTYNVHVPFFAPGSQDLNNIPESFLRQATVFQPQQNEEAHKDKVREAAEGLVKAYWKHKKLMGLDSRDAASNGSDPAADATDAKAQLYRTAADSAEAPRGLQAFIVPDNGAYCLQGESGYISTQLAKLKASASGEQFLRADATTGACSDRGFHEGPLANVCIAEADLYLKDDLGLQAADAESVLSSNSGAALAEGLAELCE